MSITDADYAKIFANNEAEGNKYIWTDTNYLEGLDILGSNPPTKAMFNSLFRNSDLKLKDLNDKIKAINEETINTAISNTNASISTLDTTANSLTSQYSTLKTTADSITADVSSMKSNIDANTASIATATTNVSNINTELGTMSTDVASSKTTANNNKTSLDALIASINTAIENANTAITNANSAIANANNSDVSSIFMVKRSHAYKKGDILMMDGLPSWALVEYSYYPSDNAADNLVTGSTAPDVSGITGSGQKITDGGVVWIVRNKALHKFLGALDIISDITSSRVAASVTATINTMPAEGDTLVINEATITFHTNQASNGYANNSTNYNLIGSINLTSTATVSNLLSSLSSLFNLFSSSSSGSTLSNSMTALSISTNTTNGSFTVYESSAYAGCGVNPLISTTGTISITKSNIVLSKLSNDISFKDNGILILNGITCYDWNICNGANGSIDARGRYIKVADSNEKVGTVEGNNYAVITPDMLPSHNHKLTDINTTSVSNTHTHTFPLTITRGDATMSHDSSTSLAAGSNSFTSSDTYYSALAMDTLGNHTHTLSGYTGYSGYDDSSSPNAPAVDIQPSRIVTMMIMQVI